MGSFRLRQGPQQRRLAGISWRSTLVGLVLGVGLIAAAPSAASAAAALSVTKSASADSVLVGQQLTYTIVVHNGGDAAAPGVGLSDELPLGVSPVSATSSPQGTCAANSIVSCSLGDIGPAQDVTVTIVTSVGPNAPSAVTNTASVSSPDGTNAVDSNDVVTTVKPAADLALTGSAIPDAVTTGELLTYTFRVQNNGPSTATGVQVADPLPAEMHFEKASDGCVETSGTVTCDLGTLASGDSRELQITVTPQQVGTFTNEGQASSAVQDPDPSNDKADVVTTVGSPPTSGGASSNPSSGPLNVVITGSYVLISGRSVKLVKGRFVPVSLTCAGAHACAGTMTVSTDKPVKQATNARKKKKRKRRAVRLGSKKFSIEGNRRQKVLVPVTKSKVKLLRRLRRVKARATIREIDVRGNPRISIRTFTLRAR
jgi:uncharacterized repeat protein (TIGR01451 family)